MGGGLISRLQVAGMEQSPVLGRRRASCGPHTEAPPLTALCTQRHHPCLPPPRRPLPHPRHHPPRLRFWDVRTLKNSATVATPSNNLYFTWSADGHYMATTATVNKEDVVRGAGAGCCEGGLGGMW